MRALVLLLVVATAAVAAPPADAATDGSCIHQRGLTGITVTASHCLPCSRVAIDWSRAPPTVSCH